MLDASSSAGGVRTSLSNAITRALFASFAAVLVATALLFAPGANEADAGSISIMGDVDCNGRVESRDAALVLQRSANLTYTLPCLLNAKIDGDYHITAVDAVLILQYSAGLIQQLPPVLDFVGTVVMVRGVEADCLALDIGARRLVFWDPTGLSVGQRVRVTGFIDPFASFCGITPLLRNVSWSILSN